MCEGKKKETKWSKIKQNKNKNNTSLSIAWLRTKWLRRRQEVGWGEGGGGEDGALANPAICRTLFYGKRELFVAGQKQEILSGQDWAIFPTCRTSQITEYMYATH